MAQTICLLFNLQGGGIRQCSWLSHNATILEVVGSISDEVIGFYLQLAYSFQWITALGSTQPLTVMSTKRQECKADNLTAICEPIA
jgi:hypothetical protein